MTRRLIRLSPAAVLLLLFASPLRAAPVAEVAYREDRGRVRVPIEAPGGGVFFLTLDTGMTFAGVYLFHDEVAKTMGDFPWQEVRVPGAGADEPSHAVMADSVTLLCGVVPLANQLFVVSTSPRTQDFPSDGVIGASLLYNFVVEIDPDAAMFRLHEPASFVPPPDFAEIEITRREGIPFLTASVSVEGEAEAVISVYIDLAAGEPLMLLVRDESPFPVPEKMGNTYLGTGLSGDIHGGVGRVARLRVGDFTFTDVPANFAPAEVRSKQEGADGILGDGVFRRFHTFFDYSRDRLYLRPNLRFDEPFLAPGN